MTEAEAEQQLFLRMHSGDEQAFVSLYRSRQAAIFRFALHMTRSETAAEDVTQDVFLAVMRESGYDPARGTVAAYLFGIARKLVLRQMERGRSDALLESELAEGSMPEPASPDNLLAELTHREGLEALARAVAALPRRYREVVVLCDLEELDYADAAAALRCPIGTVRSRLHRARELLAVKLNQERQRPSQAMKPARCTT